MKVTTAHHSSFTKHPLFSEVKPFMYLDMTGAGTNFRIQLRRRKMPHDMRRKLSLITTPCAACGETMHPLRNGRYFGATCPLTKNISCSRTAAASLEYYAIQQALTCRTAPPTPK